MTKILILGGAGFIGSYVVGQLVRNNHDVLVYDNCRKVDFKSRYSQEVQEQRVHFISRQATFVQGDIRDTTKLEEVIEQYQPEVVLHLVAMLSWESSKYPDEALSIHVDGLTSSLRALRKASQCHRYVFSSSSFVYGNFLTPCVDESHPRNPLDVYGRTKVISEELLQIGCQQMGIEFVIVRPASVYGYGDSRERLVDHMLQRALASEPVQLWDPHTASDFTFVEDIAHGFSLALLHEQAANQVFNMTRGEARTNSELAQIIASYLPTTRIERSESIAPSIEPKRGSMSIEKARRLLGFHPRYSLEQGIAHTIQQYQKRNVFEEIG